MRSFKLGARDLFEDRPSYYLRPFALICGLLVLVSGCGQLPSTARPMNASGLTLSVPAPDGISAKFTLISPVVLYRAASGSDVLSGSVSLSQLQSNAGPININLPHDGQWLVSAEWLVNGNPAYIGADLATVAGNTPFSLSLGNLNSNCYSVTLNAPTTISTLDRFVFDSYALTSSAVGGQGDVQVFLNANIPAVYLQTVPAAAAFIYLGTGNWVDFVDIPTGAAFYNDSLTAKQAVMGASAVMAVNDVYAVKLSSTNMAWIQVQSVANVSLGPYVQFLYRLNRHGYPYLKFDVTAYGDANCNTSGVTLY